MPQCDSSHLRRFLLTSLLEEVLLYSRTLLFEDTVGLYFSIISYILLTFPPVPLNQVIYTLAAVKAGISTNSIYRKEGLINRRRYRYSNILQGHTSSYAFKYPTEPPTLNR